MNLQSIAILAGFHIILIAILALDLGVFQKRAHVVGMREAVRQMKALMVQAAR